MNKKECDEKRMQIKRRLYTTLIRYLFLPATTLTFRQMSLDATRTIINSYSTEISKEEENDVIVEVNIGTNGTIAVVGKNFFTALLISGIYIPYFLVKYKDVVCHPAHGTIRFEKDIYTLNIDWNFPE